MKRTITRLVVCLVVVALIVSGIPLLMNHYRLRFNWTDSAPIGLYRENAAPLNRGQYVLVTLPTAVGKFALARHYERLTPAHTLMPVLKRIAAMPGDSVSVSDQGVTINGQLWPRSEPLAFDQAGRPLTHQPFGEYKVAPGKVWLLSNNLRGFDSRYFGPVSLSLITTTIEPVITE
jgi:conjugative transfer signal peptidase TraF